MWLTKRWFIKHTQQGSGSIKRAAAIQLVSKYSSVLIGLGSQLVLARLLTPQDYGMLAVMMVFTAFFSMLSDFGMSGAIVQNRDLNEADISSIYAWSLRMALILGIGFAIISYPVSIFYGDEIYQRLGMILAISVFFSALNMVPAALLMKRKLFLLIGLRQVTVTVFCAIVAIVLAFWGAGVYALVVSSVLNSLLNYLWNLRGSGLKFAWKVNGNSIRKIRNFSLNVLGFSFINYFARNLDNLLIGKAFGTVPLGNYNRAYQLMVYPMGMFTHVVTPALLPFIAEHQHDKEYVYEKFFATVKILSLIGIYISVLGVFCPREIVIILFGSQWENAASCFQYLSMSVWAQMICATSGAIFQAIGRADLMFQRGLFTAAGTISCIVLGIMTGSLEATAFLVSMSYFSNFLLMLHYLIKRGLDASIAAFCCQMLPDFIIASILAVVFWCLCQVEYSGIGYSFGVKLTISLLLYGFMLIKLKQAKYFLPVCPRKWRKYLEKYVDK